MERVGRGKLLLRCASVPTEGGEGRGIYSRPPTAQVTQDIGPIFLPNVGPILALANIGPILDRYRTTLDPYCTNIQPICNQYYLLYLSFSRFPLLPLIPVGFFFIPGNSGMGKLIPGIPGELLGIPGNRVYQLKSRQGEI